ncbi:MAG: hypothetical protein ACRC62_35290 [Microcoleus sp.]
MTSDNRSTVNCQIATADKGRLRQINFINYQLSTIDYQSIASGDARTTNLKSQLSTINSQLFLLF